VLPAHRERASRSLGELAVRKERGRFVTGQRGEESDQYRDDDTVIKVQAGYSYDRERPTTSFIVADRHGGGHVHRVYDDLGNEIVNHHRNR
jgi:hypothetical protein